MESVGPADPLSPESTVTTLLSSSGHLRSSLWPPEHTSTFRYRNKDYDSASAALDAYIADFDRNRQSSESLTGGLFLLQSPTPCTPQAGALRNRDVLRERLTDRELDFLHLPVSSLRHCGNQDRLSMTTDELLSIPLDGSMPVTHTSAFIHGRLSGSGAPQQSRSRAADGLCSPVTSPLRGSRMPRSCRSRHRAAIFKPAVSFSVDRSEPDQLSSWHHPVCRPDLRCPDWIQDPELSEPPPSESSLWDALGVSPPLKTRTGPPSWLAEVEQDDPEGAPAQVHTQQTLRDLRLQFAEHVSLLAAERNTPDLVESLFRENRLESLIQKADQVLSSLSQSSGGAENLTHLDPVSSDTVSQQLQPSFCEDTMVDATGDGTDTWAKGCGFHSNSLQKQPGPLEALKQTMFRLQAVEAELQRQRQTSAALPNRQQADDTTVTQRPECEALENSPVGPSLQRALHHLSRLKLLVEPGDKRRQEEEKEDVDEGRYSSASADGLVCTQQKLR